MFAKAPVAGRVKTRLARRWGAEGARGAYTGLLRHTLAVAAASGAAPLEIWGSPGRDHPWLRARARAFGAALRVQPRGDLGARMHRALADALRRGPCAVVIGGDCAGLTPDLIRAAFARLADGAEAVVVPAEDGGYVLMGVRRPLPGLFRGVPWGTGRVMAATRRRARRLGVALAELPPAWDVDHPADLHRVRRTLRVPAWPRCGRRCGGDGHPVS